MAYQQTLPVISIFNQFNIHFSNENMYSVFFNRWKYVLKTFFSDIYDFEILIIKHSVTITSRKFRIISLLKILSERLGVRLAVLESFSPGYTI